MRGSKVKLSAGPTPVANGHRRSAFWSNDMSKDPYWPDGMRGAEFLAYRRNRFGLRFLFWGALSCGAYLVLIAILLLWRTT